MRIVNAARRLGLVVDERVVDVETASGGRFGADPQGVFERWDDFSRWVREEGRRADTATAPELAAVALGPPAPAPRQVFAIGLNYREHAHEGGLELPDTPMVFTKFPSSIGGPFDDVVVPPGAVDYEAELVVVIGRTARHVPAEQAWGHVAGLTVGQDLSERLLQTKPPAPQQFSLAKSFPGFGPIGPVLVSPDEFDDPSDLEIGCVLNGEQMQKARTSDLIFGVPALIAFLSGVLTLLPGDLIFTGTPSGVGFVRDPQTLIGPGDELVTYVEGIGSMRQRFISREHRLMFTAYVIVAGLLALIATVSGVGKLTGLAPVTDTLTKVGVAPRIWPLLAGLEFAGAAGLVLGCWAWPVGAAAALGLLLYFAGAVVAHFRAGDHAIAPPTVLALVGATVLVLRLSST